MAPIVDLYKSLTLVARKIGGGGGEGGRVGGGGGRGEGGEGGGGGRVMSSHLSPISPHCQKHQTPRLFHSFPYIGYQSTGGGGTFATHPEMFRSLTFFPVFIHEQIVDLSRRPCDQSTLEDAGKTVQEYVYLNISDR
jgi:hypothetical protein